MVGHSFYSFHFDIIVRNKSNSFLIINILLFLTIYSRYVMAPKTVECETVPRQNGGPNSRPQNVLVSES